MNNSDFGQDIDFYQDVDFCQDTNSEHYDTNSEFEIINEGDVVNTFVDNINCLNFFGSVYRYTSVRYLAEKFEKAWNENQNLCIQTLFNFRDCNGKKEKRTSLIMMFILKITLPDIYGQILVNFIDYGCWKDILKICSLSNFYSQCVDISLEISMFSEQLIEDLNSEKPSLCSKWAPSEGKHYDKYFHMIRKELNMTPREYRKMLTKLRKRSQNVENVLSREKYGQINFNNVPNRAYDMYENAFSRKVNCTGIEKRDRQKMVNSYNEYLQCSNYKFAKRTEMVSKKLKFAKRTEMVSKKLKFAKKPKIPVTPYTVINEMMSGVGTTISLETSWISLKHISKDTGVFSKCLSVVDVSKSMEGGYMDIALSFGLMMSECADIPYNNKIFTFDNNPKLINLCNDYSLVSKIIKLKDMKSGSVIDLDKIFKQVLNMARFYDNLPEYLFVFTDKIFNNYKIGEMREMYKKEGFTIPQLIYWNLDSPFFTINQKDGIILYSGFSNKVIKLILNGHFTPSSLYTNTVNKYEIPITNYEKMNLGKVDIRKLFNAVIKCKI